MKSLVNGLFAVYNSNTTLVKVKLSKRRPIKIKSSYSNTTLVKVKLNKEIYAQGNAEEFKYNTC